MACNATALASAVDSCALARLVCGEVGAGKFGSYVVHWHCTFGQSILFVPPLCLWLLMFMLALCSTADTFLVPQLNYISDLLKLKPDVAGVTLLAFGNGAPPRLHHPAPAPGTRRGALRSQVRPIYSLA
jgi:solute carrier family 24 (sodium/potassium/calcium exchanger), member 6